MIKRSLLLLALLAACGDDGSVVRDDMGPLDPIVDGGFFCVSPEAQACLRGSWWTCDQNGEFLQRVEENCTEQGKICLADYGGCVDCNPGGRSCDDDNNVCNGVDFCKGGVCLAAEATGIELLLAGHFASEQFAMQALADALADRFTELDVWCSETERDPIQPV